MTRHGHLAIEHLRQAHAQWQLEPNNACHPRQLLPYVMSAEGAASLLEKAHQLIDEPAPTRENTAHPAVIVTKAPHAGSRGSIAAIVARCLAFGASVAQIRVLEDTSADAVAHTLYPDVWLNFNRLPSGTASWRLLEQKFNTEGFLRIFGQPYDRDLVVTGRQACQDNGLTHAQLAELWQEGREPLNRTPFVQRYGERAADLVFGDRSSYDWYRGRYPIGIHRMNSGLLAFSMRHESLYGGQPIVILNGHYALLAQRFHGSDGTGATVIELGLTAQSTIHAIRTRLIGAESFPEACQPGSIRRDAFDGFFETDSPSTTVTAWANVVHASDGYLAGTLEVIGLLDRRPRLLQRTLLDEGYMQDELDCLLFTDPVVVAYGDEQRLTKRTAALDSGECLATIEKYFPPLRRSGSQGLTAFPLRELLSRARNDSDLSPSRFDRPVPEPVTRRPMTPPEDILSLSPELARMGSEMLSRGGVGLLVPLAGAGGRFGGYDLPEGHPGRLKALRPAFNINGTKLSSLDIRLAHTRYLRSFYGSSMPLILSCSHLTEPHVRDWLESHQDAEAMVVRTPEMYRVRVDRGIARMKVPEASTADRILRDNEGRPLLKPSGSLGLLLAAMNSGQLDTWLAEGIEVVVAANADDVGFRVDRRVVGLFAQHPELEAVVLTTPVSTKTADSDGDGATGAVMDRGGLLREREVDGHWSVYIEEHAVPTRPYADEQYNTNQIYLRLSSLLNHMQSIFMRDLGQMHRKLPLYYELKIVTVNGSRFDAMHAYQVYSDFLRLLRHVAAIQISRHPRDGQPSGYAPLKTARDLAFGDDLLAELNAGHDELEFASPEGVGT